MSWITSWERGRFCRAYLSFGSVKHSAAALHDLFFAARRNLYRGLRLAPVSGEGILAPILRSILKGAEISRARAKTGEMVDAKFFLSSLVTL